MKRLLVFWIFFSATSLFSQGSVFKLWTENGIKVSLTKRSSFGLDWRTRIGENGFETMFPQLNFKYKVCDWFRPSIDFRYILDKSLIGEYNASSRINLNAQFNYEKKRFSAGLRIRYQHGFERIISNYDSDFDKAYRIKPLLSYDIKNSVFSPIISAEFFYDPSFAPLGRRFNKIRYFIGASLDFSGAHGFRFGYQYDQKINLPAPINKHILSLSYSYSIKEKKAKKSTTKPKSSKTL
jgi:hypothetical protein